MPQARIGKLTDQELVDLNNEGKTHTQIAKIAGWKSPGSVRYHLKRIEIEGMQGVEEEEEEVPDLAPFKEWEEFEGKKPDWREIVEHARTGADLYNRVNVNYDFVHRKIDTDDPIAVVFASDFHLGSNATDYDAFLETADFLKDSGIYMIVVGSDPEFAINRFRSSEAVHSQVLPPVMQIEAQKRWL